MAFREKTHDAVLIAGESLKSFRNNNDFASSASLAYYSFLAIIPLLLLVIYLLGTYIISSQTAIRSVEGIAATLLPQVGRIIIKEVYSLSQHKGIWGALSIITFLWSITPLTGALRTVFSEIFRADYQTPFFKAMLLDVLAVLAILVLFVSLVMGEIFYSTFAGVFFRKMPFIRSAAPFLMALVFIYLFYFIFLPVRLPFARLLTGSALTAVLWSILGPLFAVFLRFNPNYGFAFGSLKTIFILTVWVYYSFCVLLFGVEVLANMHRKDSLLLRGLFLKDPVPKRTSSIFARKFGRTYQPGDIVFDEGTPGRDMFYVLSGAVGISSGGEVLKVVKNGEYFGEMSMLLDVGRTATATVAEPDTRLVVISQASFETILREEPAVILSLLKEMAQRLKTTTKHT